MQYEYYEDLDQDLDRSPDDLLEEARSSFGLVDLYGRDDPEPLLPDDELITELPEDQDAKESL